MAIYYVAKDGADGNAGTSWVAAKQTMAGVMALNPTAGDTIYVASGIYEENFGMGTGGNSSTPLSFEAVGKVILQGVGGAGTIFTQPSSRLYSWNGFTFRNASQLHERTNNTELWFRNCRFENLTYAAFGGQQTYTVHVYGCLFRECTFALGNNSGANYTPTTRVRNCTFFNCPTMISWTGSGWVGECVNNVFIDLIGTSGRSAGYTRIAAVSDFNAFYIVDTNHPLAGSTSVAAFQSANPGRESNSIFLAGTNPLLDTNGAPITLHLSSTYWGRGQYGGHIGAHPPAVVYSPRVNISDWQYGTYNSGVARNGSTDYWELSGANVGDVYSKAIDLGVARPVRVVDLVVGITAPTNVADYATGDSAPRQWTYRYRASNTAGEVQDDPTAGAAVWTEVNLMSDLILSRRYWQVQARIRDNGV